MPLSPQAQPRAVDAVGAVVVDKAGRFLLIRRARAPMAGFWTLPGGKVEPGESFEEAVVRELREETALETRVVAFLSDVTLAREGFVYRIHEYLAVAVGNTTPRAGDDAAEVRWATVDELATLGVDDGAAAVIAHGLAEAAARDRS